jgi:DNA-binding transcriptional MerR regulator
MICEKMGISKHRLYFWIQTYGIKGEKRLVPDADGGFGTRLTFFFTDEQLSVIERIHTLLSQGYQPANIKRILQGKPPLHKRVKLKNPKTSMKIDREMHPILTNADLESFVGELTELEITELIQALKSKGKIYSNKEVFDFIDNINEITDEIEQVTESLSEKVKTEDSVKLKISVDELKSKIESFK